MKNIKDLLNKSRVQKYSEEFRIDEDNEIIYDFSKTHFEDNEFDAIKEKILTLGFEKKLKDMIEGENVNFTENRQVLHYLLREDPNNSASALDNNYSLKSSNGLKESMNEINDVLDRMHKFDIELENAVGITGKPIKKIVNIGIGGSDLGPKLVNDALSFYKKRETFFFSNIDSTDLFRQKVDLETSLFVIVSKTFTTLETLKNANLIIELFRRELGPEMNIKDLLSKHFVAATANESAEIMQEKIRTFKFFDFVGGRYSLWSGAGISICLGLGFDIFKKLLKGANLADRQFFDNKLNSISGTMAIVEIFYRNIKYSHSTNYFNNKCIVAYDSNLELLHKYIQQAEMESNGKLNSGQKIIWGGVGTDVQHSFFQMLHQNDENVYLEMLLPMTNMYAEKTEFKETRKTILEHHKLLISNCLAQTRALMLGKDSKDPNLLFKGNKPSTTILYNKLTPETLGFMLAVYEHKIFIEGIYYGINSFDQFGVQLGKELALEIYAGKGSFDASTDYLLERIQKNQQ